jgi:hypothetical protein
MGAPVGNKNAETKWTFEESEKLLDQMIEASNELDFYLIGSGQYASNVEGYKYDFIGELSLAFKVYHQLVTRDIFNKFPELRTKINTIISLMERNCYYNTKKGIINTAVGIVNLKSNHKWTDRTSTDHTTQGEKITPPITWVDGNTE